MNTTPEPVVARYLDDLERALSDLPRSRQREIVDEIRDHIDEAAVAASADHKDVDLRAILDQVGDPEAIAAEARERFGISRPRAGVLEVGAIALLLVGGVIVPLIGWIVGAVLLWTSRVWTIRDKLIGTLLIPGGLALPILAFVTVASACSDVAQSGGSQIRPCPTWQVQDVLRALLLAAAALAPLGTAIYLGRRAWNR